MKHRRHHPLLALAIIGSLLLGACSSDGDEDADDTPATTEEATGSETEDESAAGDDQSEDESKDESKDETDAEPVDVGGDGQPYVDAMVASMLEDEDFPLTEADAECFSSRFIDTIGADRLQDAGITPEAMAGEANDMEFPELGLSEDEGNELYDHFGDCGIDLREVMLQSFAEDEDMTPGMQSCMETVLTDENLRTFMVVAMVQGEAAFEDEDSPAAEVMGGLMGCAFMGLGEEMEAEGVEAPRN